MYIHKSLDQPKFLSDRKLNLLRHNVITWGQFINLIQISDPYTVIGPAVIDKNKINQFIQQWNTNGSDIVPIQQAFVHKITNQQIIDQLPKLIQIFPQIKPLYLQLKGKLVDARCPICQKNKYVILIVGKIQQYYRDGRDLKQSKQFVLRIIDQYFPFITKYISQQHIDQYDITWIKKDQVIALGQDLIIGLTNCCDCCKKHLIRAKILFEQWLQKYPDHGTLMYNEFTEANKVIEQGFVMLWSSIGQLDMASCQLVGSIVQLPDNFKLQLIELANLIRKSRILFQQNSANVPDFNQLITAVQILRNKINQVGK